MRSCISATPTVRPRLIRNRRKVDAPPWTEPNDCTGNVQSVIEIHGGTVQYGWQLWETWRGVLLEGEFHAIWVDEHGRWLVCLRSASSEAIRKNSRVGYS